MRISRLVLIICFLFQSSYVMLGQCADLTGTWESKYSFGFIEEVMTADIQVAGDNLLGSFSVQPSQGDKYSGVIFGTINGNRAKVYYLTARRSKGPEIAISFADCQLIDENTITGTFYYQDSDMNALPPSPFEAIRK